MDKGIKGKTAIVCASSRGLGKGCAVALASEGVDLIINGRDQETLAFTAKELREKYGVKVTEFCADITIKDQQIKLIELCPNPDILVNNAGGPPPGDFRDWEREDWMNACIANMFTPIELIKAYVDGMQDRKFGRIKIYNKTLEGALAGFVICLMSGLIIDLNISILILTIGALSATIIELLPISIDDNLRIPLFSGTVMYAMSIVLI